MNSRDRRVRIRSQVWGIEVARYCVALYLIEEHGVVVSAPAFHRLKLLYHRNERAEVRKEDHIENSDTDLDNEDINNLFEDIANSKQT